MAKTKPTREELQATDFYKQHMAKAKSWLAESTAEDLESSAYVNLPLAESPLEAAFLVWWSALRISGMASSLAIDTQRNVVAQGDPYRLDIVIRVEPYGEFGRLVDHPQAPKIAIELDGHEFHERTKEQVQSRNMRDRALSAEGWLVWHYSGSEFHRDPVAVMGNIHEQAYGEHCKAMRAAGFWQRKAVNA